MKRFEARNSHRMVQPELMKVELSFGLQVDCEVSQNVPPTSGFLYADT